MPLIESGTARVAVTASARTRVSPAAAFDRVVPVDLPTILPKYGPLPGVAGVRDQNGAWDHVGLARTIVLTDDSTMREQLTEYVKHTMIGYELSGLPAPLRQLARGVRGEWTFTPDGTGAIIRWTWELVPLPGRRAALRYGFAPLWRRYMQKVVDGCAQLCDS